MKFIKYFSELNKSDTGIAGGKGASLGEMFRAGFPIPPGFVVLSQAFDRFLRDTDLIVEVEAQLKKVNPKKINTVDDASEILRQLINKEKMPKEIQRQVLEGFEKLGAKYTAVRSSATAEDSKTASWAGELESYLGIQRKDLIKYVQQCWSSLFTPRAIFYRIEKGLGGKNVSVAVVAQKMIESEVAGVCFTVHPVTQDRNQMVIEASWGLGESVVSGKVTPDTYIINKSELKTQSSKVNEIVLDKSVNEQFTEITRQGQTTKERPVPKQRAGKQCLSDKKIIELAKICQKIERHYGFPCDIEWALEKGKLYIVQSRPVTTLMPEAPKTEPLVLLGVWNVLPLEAWRWFADASIDKLEKLTGVRLRIFTYIKEELNYEAIFEYELNQLREKFEQQRKKKEYINKIYKDFYKEVPPLEKYMLDLEQKNINKLTDQELAFAIQKLADLWANITMQIWYAVFLDIWYPSENQNKAVKKIAAKARDYTGCLHERSNKVEHKLYIEAAKRMKIDSKGINYLFPNEITDGLLNNVFYAKEIKRRSEFCVNASVEGKWAIYSGKKARGLFKKYQPPSVGNEALSELAGTPANGGKITGLARIIRRDIDFDKFKNGEILVVLQTMVHYLPIMKKSKAIVTEFGGLTSHAAIVSREINKPCIVGITNLLASVKDGDLVEVDANRGIIKILKKAK